MQRPLFASLICTAFSAFMTFSTASAQVVFIDYDDASAKVHGAFPSRAQIAELTGALHSAGAKAVVLKFFLDGPGKEPDNTRLAEAIGRGRTVLQATINLEPPTSRDLPQRFRFPGKAPFEPGIRGDEGWLPLTRFTDKAARVCFVDVRSPERVPMLQMFGGHPVPSLYSCLLAELNGKEMSLSSRTATFGTTRIALDKDGEAAIRLDPRRSGARIPAQRIFAGHDWQSAVRGNVAVLMYTGPQSPTLPFNGKAEKVHDLFAAQLGGLQAAALWK